jgi:hypothetical protein
MIDTKLLEEQIDRSGKKKSYLAKQLGCTIQTFRTKCIGQYEFKVSEVETLCNELGITDLEEKEKIFFKK